LVTHAGGVSPVFGDHPDGAARALRHAETTPLAEVEVDAKALSGAQLDDGVVRTDAVAVVAFEAVPAREAAARLEERVVGCEAAVHLVERRAAQGGVGRGLRGAIGLGVVPGIQGLEGGHLAGRRRLRLLSAYVRVE